MAGPSSFPEPGQALGGYRLLRRLGQGGMGVVFEAEDSGLQRRVALKVISLRLADDPGFRARFVREARAQASLDSPHVVHVFDHGEVDGQLYIATQLVPDGDLGGWLRGHGAAPPWLALDLGNQIASGLADAHDAGLVHRDLKPANVLLRRRGRAYDAYLTDFGIARRVDAGSGHTSSGYALGTPAYMAPELHTGGDASVASDLYSLGCLLWATLTGAAPYPGTTEFQIIDAHVSAPLPRLRDDGPVAHDLDALLARLLAKDPAQRPTSAEEVAVELRRLAARAPDAVVAAGATPGPRPTGPPAGPTPTPTPASPVTVIGHGPPPTLSTLATPAPPPRRRGPLVAAAVVALLVVIGLGIGGVALLGGDDSPTADPPPRSPGTSGSGTSGSTGSTSSTGSTPDPSPPTPSSSYFDGLSDDERTAAASLADALVDDEQVDRPTAECVAARIVQDEGVESLRRDGILNDDYTFDSDSQASASFLVSTLTASFGCALDSTG